MRFLAIFAVVLAANFLPGDSLCLLDKVYMIRDNVQGFAIDVETPEVSLGFADGYNSQLWKFECAGPPGVYYIVNMNTWKALDIDRNASPNKLIESARDYNSDYQKWYINSDGTIANGGNKLFLTIHDGTPVAGATLELSDDNSQKFLVQPRN